MQRGRNEFPDPSAAADGFCGPSECLHAGAAASSLVTGGRGPGRPGPGHPYPYHGGLIMAVRADKLGFGAPGGDRCAVIAHPLGRGGVRLLEARSVARGCSCRLGAADAEIAGSLVSGEGSEGVVRYQTRRRASCGGREEGKVRPGEVAGMQKEQIRARDGTSEGGGREAGRVLESE